MADVFFALSPADRRDALDVAAIPSTRSQEQRWTKIIRERLDVWVRRWFLAPSPKECGPGLYPLSPGRLHVERFDDGAQRIFAGGPEIIIVSPDWYGEHPIPAAGRPEVEPALSLARPAGRRRLVKGSVVLNRVVVLPGPSIAQTTI